MSPAYGFIALALVKCSNDGGPGPRHNMKEDPGSSIFSMLVVYGYYLYLLPLFSEPGDWKDQCGPSPQIGLEEDVETILIFSARLYEVRELSWRPAQVDQRASS